MSRREKEKKASLDALARVVRDAEATQWVDKKPRTASLPPPSPPSRSPSRSPSPPSPARAPAPDVLRARKLKAEDRRAKLEEDRRLKQRRAGELTRSANLEWRGMDNMGVPSGIRRTAFDRDEPSVSQKINDVLGDAKEKEGRAKNRAKGRRQG